MKVVVVASLAFSLTNFRGRLLRAMVDAGHQVIACAPDRDAKVEAALAEMGVAFRHMPMKRTGLNPLVDLLTLGWLVRLFATERPSIVLAYTQKPIVYSGIAARLVGRVRFFPMVTGLGHAFAEGGSRVLRVIVSTLYRLALARAEAVFVYNEADAADLDPRGRRSLPLVMVPGSGVDLARFSHEPVPIDPPTFLMIARLLRSKGLFEFVEAARLVRQSRPDARFEILGPLDPNPAGIGPDELAAWQREGVVSYLGETREVRPFLAGASVFVLPTWYREGLPRTILEAMATGRAVITTDMPGCRDAVTQGVTGLLVPPRDAAALADAMLAMIEVPGTVVEMGRNARHAAEERFTVERINAILLGTMGLGRTAPASGHQSVEPVGSVPIIVEGMA